MPEIDAKAGMRLLDIGCGWGALAKHAAQHYGAKVMGITLSLPQKLFAEESCRGLPVTFQVQDYRDLPDRDFRPGGIHRHVRACGT